MVLGSHSDKLGFSPPQSYEQLDAIEELDRLYTPGHLATTKVVRYAPGVVVKYGSWEQFYAEEVLCMRFAEKLGLPVPKVLYHPGTVEKRVPWSLDLAMTEPDLSDSVWCICMEEIHGMTLENALNSMSDDQLVNVAHQLKTIVACIAKPRSSYIGSVTGDPFRSLLVPYYCQPDCTFSTTSDFMNYLLHLLTDSLHSKARAESVLAPFLDSNDEEQPGEFCFAHGDLLPKNIMVDPENEYAITAILDWENAGFHPPRWDYYRMHDSTFMTPNWSRILDIVYDQQPRDDAKIEAVRDTLLAICTFV